ncbi:MAG: 4Fe-4S dicluster domain-containing protein [Promethearchaeota archaeon]|nr:MAG: 4Fe-4S dicluster domain-containing protein [Candidatus Lokiarchaeota archaeon]
MCDHCLKHGTAGKWYLNAENYSKELAEELNLKEFFLEQYKNFEAMQVRKIAGLDGVGLGYKIKMPIIGRITKHFAEKMLHSQKPKHNPFRAEGHIGQVIPLHDATSILEHCVDEDSIILKYCMCRFMHQNVKEACCINFGIMSEVIDKLPRFKPEKDKFHISKDEAIAKFKSFHEKGYIGTIWYGMYPYISNLCACATPACAGIRPRVEFDIKTVFKAEYVAQIDPDNCQGCKSCINACKFDAIHFNEKEKVSEVDLQKCYGCGVCIQRCKFDALILRDRKAIPEIALEY